MNPTLTIRYDPRLVEEAVFHARRRGYVLKGLDARRNRIYEVPDPDEREKLFNELHDSWFVRLGLNQTIEAALREQPIIAAEVESCFIVCAAQAREQGAELFVDPARRTVRLALGPDSLLDRERLLIFLRRELFHIADMLDPKFAYEPVLPKAEGGPTYDTLITNRYRALWDVTIHGRMARRGWLPESERAEQLAYFRGAFPMLKDNAEESFHRFFDSDGPTHPELAAFAFDPRAAAGTVDDEPVPGTHCPLCKFPTHAFETQPDQLGEDLLAAIKGDFENWTPSMGLCAQCADLYRASRLSLAAAKALPGWTPGPAPKPTHHGRASNPAAAGGK